MPEKIKESEIIKSTQESMIKEQVDYIVQELEGATDLSVVGEENVKKFLEATEITANNLLNEAMRAASEDNPTWVLQQSDENNRPAHDDFTVRKEIIKEAIEVGARIAPGGYLNKIDRALEEGTLKDWLKSKIDNMLGGEPATKDITENKEENKEKMLEYFKLMLKALKKTLEDVKNTAAPGSVGNYEENMRLINELENIQAKDL